jgi:hypothetical protein
MLSLNPSKIINAFGDDQSGYASYNWFQNILNVLHKRTGLELLLKLHSYNRKNQVGF